MKGAKSMDARILKHEIDARLDTPNDSQLGSNGGPVYTNGSATKPATGGDGTAPHAPSVPPATRRAPQTSNPMTADTIDSTSKRAPRNRGKKPNYAQIHAKPLPLDIHPLPAFHPSNPISLLRLCYVYLSQLLITRPTSHPSQQEKYIAYFHPASRTIEVTNPIYARALWDSGFFGKGSLSRSEPSWLNREKARRRKERAEAKAERDGGGERLAAEDVRAKRREERRLFKLERARLERERIERQKAVEEGRMTKEEAARLEAAEGEADAMGGAEVDERLKVDATSETPPGKSDDPPSVDGQANRSVKASDIPSNKSTAAPPTPTTTRNTQQQAEEDELEDEKVFDQEHLQLSPEEAFFLSYALGVLDIVVLPPPDIFSPPMSPRSTPLSAAKSLSPLALMSLFAEHAESSIHTIPSLNLPSHLAAPKIAVNDQRMHARAVSHAIYTAPFVFDPTETSLKVPVDAAPLHSPTSPPTTLSLALEGLTSHPEPDNQFMIRYAVYHHFRSLGWVVRSGIKFGVDYLLYHRGPVFSHAEFTVLIMPSYVDPCWKSGPGAERMKEVRKMNWWQLHCVNRVQSQVLKSLVLVYVEVPAPFEDGIGVAEMMKRYKIREVIIRRWSPNRSRD